MARLAPLTPPYPLEAVAELALMPADLGLFRTVAHNPRVLSRWRGADCSTAVRSRCASAKS